MPAAGSPVDTADRRTAGGTLPPADGAAATADPAAYQAALDAARARAGAHGISAAIARDGELVWAGSSGRGRDGLSALDPGSTMVIGSVTKTFVAAAILRLAERNQLQLDDPVRDHLPELGDLSRRITLRNLLDHTSGLADLFNDTTRRGLEEHPARAWTSAEVLGTLRAPWYSPGEGWAYANTNYFLLGLVIERITGETLGGFLEQEFFAPLGLDARVLTGAPEDPLEPAWTSIFWASGAMIASATDLARWGDALFLGSILSADSRDAMLSVNGHDYGLGVQRIEVGSRIGYGHTGLLNTYTTLLLHLPDEGVTIALLVNRSHVNLGSILRGAPSGGGPSLLELALAD